MMAINKANNKVKIGEVIKEIIQAPDKDREMMDITMKINFGKVPEGQVEEAAEVEVVDHGLIILILMDNPQIKTLNAGEEEIKIGEGDVDITHNKINPQFMNIIIIHPKCCILI